MAAEVQIIRGSRSGHASAETIAAIVDQKHAACLVFIDRMARDLVGLGRDLLLGGEAGVEEDLRFIGSEVVEKLNLVSGVVDGVLERFHGSLDQQLNTVAAEVREKLAHLGRHVENDSYTIGRQVVENLCA